VAEKVVFGDRRLQQVQVMIYNKLQNIARQMVTRYGMSSIGPIALEDNNNEQIFMGGNEDAISDRIDAEVCKIVNHCEQVATKIVLDNRVIIDLIVEKLLDAETLTGDEFRSLLKQYTIPPIKK
jgi:cell division protease FtsH